MSSPRALLGFGVRFLVWLSVLCGIAAPAVNGVAIAATRTSLVWAGGGHVRSLTGDAELCSLGPFVFALVSECTAVPAMLQLSAAICASRAAAWLKWAGVLGGSIVLWCANLIRILAVATTFSRWPEIANLVHYFGQYLMLVLVFLLFPLWITIGRGRRAVA